MTTRKRTQNIKKIKADLRALVRDGEHLLRDEGDNLSRKGEELRDQLSEALEAARECCCDLETKAWDQLEDVDETVHKNPYQFMGIACGVGVLIGLLMGKSR
jgi:ElaB/YqjD/DUF883 family membrane-anchored ribosome-binding protein